MTIDVQKAVQDFAQELQDLLDAVPLGAQLSSDPFEVSGLAIAGGDRRLRVDFVSKLQEDFLQGLRL